MYDILSVETSISGDNAVMLWPFSAKAFNNERAHMKWLGLGLFEMYKIFAAKAQFAMEQTNVGDWGSLVD